MSLLANTFLIFKLLIGAQIAFAATSPPKISEYFIEQKMVLTKKIDGIDGLLEIWRDKRLTDEDIKLMQEHDPDNDPIYSLKFKWQTVKPAIVVMMSANSQIIQFFPLEKPHATLREKYIDGQQKRIFLITQDFGIILGSYNGPITRLLEVRDNSMAWMKTFDKKSIVPISLMRSLKSAWNFDSKTDDILEVHCRPDDSPEGFITSFSRYHS